MKFLRYKPWQNTCDGIGGTVKHLAARASLQHTTENHILTPTQLFDWCSKNINGVKFFFISSATITEHATLLKDRFEKQSTMPGTRDNHQFVPLSNTELKVSRVSGDNDFSVYSTIGRQHPTVTEPKYIEPEVMSNFEVGQYASCPYDQKWYIGTVLQYDEEYEEYRVKFMQPNGPSRWFVYTCLHGSYIASM